LRLKKSRFSHNPHRAGRVRIQVWCPVLGARPLASIRPGEVMKAVQKIEARGAGDQAARVLQRIKHLQFSTRPHGLQKHGHGARVPSAVFNRDE
jgi:hypothetical protein